MQVLCIFVSLVVAIKAAYEHVGIPAVGVPLAVRIKEYEDKLFAEGPEMEARVVGIPGIHRRGVQEKELPFVAALLLRMTDGDVPGVCAASIVSSSRLVTAAHCLTDTISVRVRVGSLYVFYEGTVITSTDFTPHPRFNLTRSRDNDIGVIRLPQELQFSDTVQMVALPTKDVLYEAYGDWGLAAGWGLTSDSQRGRARSIRTKLNEVSLQIVDVNNCSPTFDRFRIIVSDYIICTDGSGGRGTCDGDSGGPLVVDKNGTKVLVGVISQGGRPCEASIPSVFAKVRKYIGFINCENVISDQCPNPFDDYIIKNK